MKKLKTFEDFNTDTDSEYDYKYHKNRVSGAGPENGSTELIDAVKHQDIEAVEDLIKLGADVNEEDEQGYTPTDYALSSGSAAILLLLREYGAKDKYHIDI